MPFVLDASTTACWIFEDESHPYADAAFALVDQEDILVPSFLWWLETRNILVLNERRRRLTENQTIGFLRFLSGLTAIQDLMPDEAEILRVARQYRLTVYDAAYLELALRKKAALATLDAELIRAAKAEGVPIIGENL